MRLNTISPAEGSKQTKRRVGRGIGSGLGKTCGKGHKGQKARSGGYHKRAFEGGQMPLQMRLPKFGFTSRKAPFIAEVRLDALAKVTADVIDMEALKAASVITPKMVSAKVILAGKIEKAVKVKGIRVTKGARAAIEAAGGSVED